METQRQKDFRLMLRDEAGTTPSCIMGNLTPNREDNNKKKKTERKKIPENIKRKKEKNVGQKCKENPEDKGQETKESYVCRRHVEGRSPHGCNLGDRDSRRSLGSLCCYWLGMERSRHFLDRP